jgi:hypothetical protein
VTTGPEDERRKGAAVDDQRRQLRQRRHRMLFTATLVLAVVALIGIAAVVALNRGGSGALTTPATKRLVRTLTTLPTVTFDTVGAGNVSDNPKKVTDPVALTEGSKPKVLYVGAEYCPFCAAERWAVVTALSRFGTFHDLGQTTSSGADEFPDTPTLSFHGATYTSKYLAFNGYETASNQIQGKGYAPLDKLPATDNQTFLTYDFSPYESGLSQGAVPFIDFGGQWLQSGASYDPGLFKGLTYQQAANEIADPSSDISQAVLGTANTFTALVCGLTQNQPTQVCTSSAVTAAQSNLR